MTDRIYDQRTLNELNARHLKLEARRDHLIEIQQETIKEINLVLRQIIQIEGRVESKRRANDGTI